MLLVGVLGLVSVFAAGGFSNLASLGGTQVAAAAAADLSSAGNFGVLAGSAISDAGGSTVDEDMGLSPTTGAAITGILAAQVSGTIYAVDAAGPAGSVEDPGLLSTAKSDLSNAYDDLESQDADASIGAIGAGQTMLPGVYNSGSTISLTGSLTLDAQGDPDAVFIFQAGSSLTTGSASTIVLTDGAQACNVFWQVGSSATLGTGSTFKGNILAMQSITDDGGSTVEGRLLAQVAAVTLNNTDVVVPPCIQAAKLHVVKVVTNDNTGTSTPSDFTLHVQSGGTDVSQGPSVGSSSPGTLYSIAPGSYTITEDADAGYTQTFGGDCDATGAITLAEGEDATCTVTNNDIPGPPGPATLNVIKTVVNTGDGSATSSDFTVHVRATGTDVAGSPAPGAAGPGTSYSLAAGTYTVTEDANALYTQDFSGDCDATGAITLSASQVATCTITNTDIPDAAAGAASSGGNSSGSRRQATTTSASITSAPSSTTTTATTNTTQPPPTTSPAASPGFPNSGLPPKGE